VELITSLGAEPSGAAAFCYDAGLIEPRRSCAAIQLRSRLDGN